MLAPAMNSNPLCEASPLQNEGNLIVNVTAASGAPRTRTGLDFLRRGNGCCRQKSVVAGLSKRVDECSRDKMRIAYLC